MTAVTAPPGELSRSVRLSYSAGAVGTGIYSTVPGLLLLYYLTDVVGVGAGLAGLVVFLPKVWDAVLNPLVGTLSDRTRSRWGPRRPFLLAGAVVVPVMFAVLFSSPDLGSPTRSALYVGVAYTLAMTGFALFQVPWVAMPAEMTDDYHERTRLMSSRMVLLTLGILLGGVLAPLLSGGKEGGRGGYTRMGLILGVLLAAALLTAWRGTRDAAYAAPDTSPRPSVADQLALVRSNPAFTRLLGVYALQSVAVGAMLAGAQYIAKYVLGNEDAAAVLFACLVVPSALVVPLWRRLSLRIGKLRGFRYASAVFAAAALSLVVADHVPSFVVFVLVGLIGVGYAGMQLFPYAMLPDALSVSGTSRSGVFTGVWQAGETAGLALGSGLYAAMLALSGFVSSAADDTVPQSAGALLGIVLGFSLLPAVLVGLTLPLLRRYTATDTALAAARALPSPHQPPVPDDLEPTA